MTLIESQLLSKVLDDNNFYELSKYGITSADFDTLPDVYAFIESYVKQYGDTPDYLTVVEKYEDFEYTETTNNLAYMAKTVKSDTAKRKMYNILQHEASDKFSKMSGAQFTNWMADRVNAIADDVNTAGFKGVNLAQNGRQRLEQYLESKAAGEDKYLPSPYPSINKWLGGGFELGDYVLLLAYTNKGKSWISADCGKAVWEAGYGVLDYRPEISEESFATRFDTVSGQFNNMAIKNGSLSDSEEDRYFSHLNKFNETQEVPYILKTMEHMPKGISVSQIEADLKQHPEVSFVIIDGFSLMDHGGSGREALTATSRKLRQLFGRMKVTGLVVHQTPTTAEKESRVAEDSRMPATPDITDYSETVAVVQDALTVLTFNQVDGVGALHIAKSKSMDTGKTVELHCNFNMGTIRERELLDDI